jgi:hypothetical protein
MLEEEFVVIGQPKRQTIIWRPNRLAEARYKLTPRQQKLLLYVIARLIDIEVIRTTLADHFGTINAANLKKAHALIESGKSRGKIVLESWR